MSCYKGDNPIFLDIAIKSVLDSSILPNQFVLVVDGPINMDLQSVINKYASMHSFFEVFHLEYNLGLGPALQFGLGKCKFEWVARMDSDDINCFDRFEFQIKAISQNSHVSLIGTQIEEFYDGIDKPFYRYVPLNHNDILERLKLQSPFNHVTVMFKRDLVLDAGGYKELLFLEDYYLWWRFLKLGNESMNIPKIGVKVRVGKDMLSRRRGFRYVKSEIILIYSLYSQKLISIIQGLKMFFFRIPPRIMPVFLLRFVYYNFLRK